MSNSASAYKILLPSMLLALALSGCGAGEESTDSSSQADNGLPTVDLSSDAYTVDMNSDVTLSWTSKLAEQCIASGFWEGEKLLEGSETVGPLTDDTTLSLSCSGPTGMSVDTVSITVNRPADPIPTLSLQASADTVSYNGSTILSWSSTDATSCVASGDWGGDKSLNGSETIEFLTQDSSFVLSCSGDGGTANYSVDISVLPQNSPLPTVSISASDTTIESNGSTTLSWSSTNATGCLATGDWDGDKAASGTQTINSITSDSIFNLSCSGSGGVAQSSVSVTVIAPELPTITFSTSETSVATNGSTTLSWSSTNATGCLASGDWSGDKAVSGSQTINSITSDSVFNLSCSGAGGTVQSSVNVVVVDPELPTITFSASETSVATNGSTTLSWTSTNATGCLASGDWSGDKAVSGSQTIDSITSDSVFNLSCSGAGGTVQSSVNVVVVDPELPTITFSASETSVATNGSTTLSWTSANATACLASGDWSGDKAVSGSQTINSITSDSVFNLSCSGAGGSAQSSVNVVVIELPTIDFSASPTSVTTNGSTTLSWTSTNATSCEASGDWTGTQSLSGSQVIDSIVSDKAFTLTCSGSGGTAEFTVNVTVVMSNNGTALLSWTPPTENTDDSTLTDLTGYKIYYGTTSGNYNNTVTITDAGISSYTIENLEANNTWYFVMTAFNSDNIESSMSTEVSKVIN